jgi:subtilisin
MTVSLAGSDGLPIADATIVAFSNFVQRQGGQGTTGPDGKVKLQLSSQTTMLERVYVYVEGKYWSLLLKNVPVRSQLGVVAPLIDLNTPDVLAGLYAMTTLQHGAGVRVGVIDSGVSLDHPDLSVSGGLNCVRGDGAPGDFGSLGGGHGTHVAGIIAGRGTRPTGMRGLAPATDLRSYRVFPSSGDGASNFDIIKAIEQAVADGCHLINMSLGGGNPDPGTERAISFAWNSGCVSVVATGNDERSPVSFPASYELSCAVSAFGKFGSCPDDTVSSQALAPPSDPTGKYMVADFSNVGPETDFTGPGVGVVSTLPGKMYAALDGTSMACPAVCGRAAALLGQSSAILGLPADTSRSTAIRHLMEQSAQLLGFGVNFEGFGYLP